MPQATGPPKPSFDYYIEPYEHREDSGLEQAQRALVDLCDDVATRVLLLFYLDAADALRKALNDG